MRIFNLPNPPGTRKCNDPNDWDDVETVGKHLKRKGIKGLGNEGDFGIYLGFNEVGIKSLDFRWYVKDKIKYNSSEEMHLEWELD